MIEEIIGIGLSGGKGERLRPLTLKSDSYMRSKGVMHILGKRPLTIAIDSLKRQGVSNYILIAKGKENRYQIKRIVGYGEHLDVDIKYPIIEYDKVDNGSAGATLLNIEYFNIDSTVFVFPNDTLFDINLKEAYGFHKSKKSILTILTAKVRATSDMFDTRNEFRYGIINRDKEGKVAGFVEKPSPQKLMEMYNANSIEELAGVSPVINAGIYLMDSKFFRELSRKELKDRQIFDFGRDLLPWLVKNGFSIFSFPLEKWGDFGDIPTYLDTAIRGLKGEFACLGRLGTIYDAERNLYIEKESLYIKDKYGKTLEEKIKNGGVDIKNSRVGKYVQIASCCQINECDIEDDCVIHEGTKIEKSSLGEGTIVGEYAKISETVTGLMAEIESSKENPTFCEDIVAIGDEAIIGEGSALSNNARIWPHINIPKNSSISMKVIKKQEEL